MKIAGQIVLDYGAAATSDLLDNLSGVALTGEFLWTVSDEGRSAECLKRTGDGYALHAQIELVGFIEGMPEADKNKELDLESIDIAGERLWLCGSHCRVRKKPEQKGQLNHKFGDRESRRLLAALPLSPGGGGIGEGRNLPFVGAGSLRNELESDPYLKPFMNLPSKENGFDIEGLAIHEGKVLLGLRGPRIDSFAVVVSLALKEDFTIRGARLNFLDLDGLAVRELARAGKDVLVLGGPIGDAAGPFELFRWRPKETDLIQPAERLFSWPETGEKPEAICTMERNGRAGLLTLYDSPDRGKRVDGTRYMADWLEMG